MLQHPLFRLREDVNHRLKELIEDQYLLLFNFEELLNVEDRKDEMSNL